MDLKNYKVFIYTDKQLKRKHSKKILDKYYKLFAYLYQNGFDVNCEESEIEENLFLYNYFENEEDLKELRNISKIHSDYSIGKKIVTEELYEISKKGKFCHKEESSATIIKLNAEANWDKIISLTKDLEDLYFSKDSEIYNILSKLENYQDVRNKILLIKDKISKDLKVISWNIFISLINISYSTYIQLGKTKSEVHKYSIFENINNEIYGYGGGYNPINKEINVKCFSSSVNDILLIKRTKNANDIRNKAKIIIKENKHQNNKDAYFNFLEYFVRTKSVNEKEIERARQIVINCLLNGCLTLLMLKHNFSLIDYDSKNSIRADGIKEEFCEILKYCNIDKEYLF